MHLNEGYINIIGNSSIAMETKYNYVDEVWDILQNSYASIGGIKGNGFESPESMINNIPFWKLITDSDGYIKALMLYKDKQGRKRVAIGTDGTSEGKIILASMFRKEYERAYSEQSGPSLKFSVKILGIQTMKKYALNIDDVRKIVSDEIKPYNGKGDIPSELEEFAYIRNVNGSWIPKVMFGKIGNSIFN